MARGSVLISGIGVAGPTLAYWLLRHGFKPTLVEIAPRLRTGGYIIDFWGVGYDVAERMGLLRDIHDEGYPVTEVRFVDSRGRKCGGFDAGVFRRMTRDRFTSLRRSDLSRIIFERIEDRCEIIFGDTIETLEPHDDRVDVTFAHAPSRQFDAVIGADGLHSNVRRLTFGPGQNFERYLNYAVAAFETRGYRPRDELVYASHGVPGRQISRFAMRDDRTMFLFVFVSDTPPGADPDDVAAQKRLLHEQFDGTGWESEPILRALDAADELYFDRVSQIRMDAWSRGRVALLGDAAFCPSLLAGEGTGLAMAAAYVLAGEMAGLENNLAAAFARYDTMLRRFITQKQDSAARFASSFAPRTRFGLWTRNVITRTFDIPAVADFFVGRDFVDRLQLPRYESRSSRSILC